VSRDRKEVFVRRGLIYKVPGKYEWSRSHCQCPVALPLDDRTVRIYFATRDAENRSCTTFIESDIERPDTLTYVHEEPCITLGDLGTFDDCGVMPSWIVAHQEALWLYYTGWNAGGNVPYRTAVGLAISRDGGRTFHRHSVAPVLDRSRFDPSWVAQPCVAKLTDGFWMMWYLSCTNWSVVRGRPEPHYHVKFAVSVDGIEWHRTGDVALDYDEFTGAIGRPVVVLEDSIYKMYFSYRSVEGYRDDPEQSYRLGYAESADGVRFNRRDDLFEMAGQRGAWESVMNEYAVVYRHRGAKYLVYNGNGFGREGMGYAVAGI
jgi:hypothetical protein